MTQLYQLDPMGRTVAPRPNPAFQPYEGELIADTDLDPAIQRTPAGLIKGAIWAYHGAARGLPTTPTGIRIVPPEIDFYSERFTGKPYDNCQICSAMTALRWAGYDIPDGYDDVIRKAIPVPDPEGTDTAEVMRGIDRLFPGHPIQHGDITEQFLLDNLKYVGKQGRRRAAFALVVQTGKWPTHYQRLVGQGYDGLHGIAVVAKQ